MRNFISKIFVFLAIAYQGLVNSWVKNGMLGGYVHDTAMSQFIGCTDMHPVTGTWTLAAGSVSGTIAYHKAAAAETAVVNIPIHIPSNSVALKGSYLKSIEIDYEILIIACTSVTAALNKVTRGADVTGLSVASVTVTQDLVAAVAAATMAKHKLTVTLTTPVWILNTEYMLLKLTIVAAATSTIDMLSAVANFTARM
jgi:hypothetical protein